MIELALVVMLLITLSLGASSSSAGPGGRVDVDGDRHRFHGPRPPRGKDPQADYFALTSLKASLESSRLINGLQQVVVFRADSLDGGHPTACKSGTPARQPAIVATSTRALRSGASTSASSTPPPAA